MVLLGTNKIVQYMVKDGDNLWDISRAVNIDLDQIIFTNPGMDGEFKHRSGVVPEPKRR